VARIWTTRGGLRAKVAGWRAAEFIRSCLEAALALDFGVSLGRIIWAVETTYQ
jgi:hypothetical protein